jgi:hypothetical protein
MAAVSSDRLIVFVRGKYLKQSTPSLTPVDRHGPTGRCDQEDRRACHVAGGAAVRVALTTAKLTVFRSEPRTARIEKLFDGRSMGGRSGS